MNSEKYSIKDEADYDYAKKRFQELFHACPCITDNEEGIMLFDALEEYEKRVKLERE